MDRKGFWRLARYTLVGLLMASALSSTGCVAMLATIAYLVKGTDLPAEYDGLRKKRVAVVCRPPVSMNQDQTLACRELGIELSRKLEANVRDIDVVSQQDVADWTDENNLERFVDIGKALDADMVVAVEMDEFSLYRSSSVYQGRASYRLQVFNIEKNGKITFEKQPGQTMWPPSGGEPVGRPANDFRRRFVQQLSEEMGRYFYPHDPTMNVASDATMLDIN